MNNREIKFRVWHKTEKRFVDIQKIEFDKKRVTFDSPDKSCYHCSNFEGVIFQQSTGMFDRNGKEIYEGDILVENHDGGEGEVNIGQVFFAAGTFMIDGDGIFYDHVYSASPDILEDYTVQGNIIENSELLKQ